MPASRKSTRGTNGIQSIDLVMRKLPMSGGAAVRNYIGELRGIIAEVKATNDPAFGATAQRLGETLDHLGRATEWLLGRIYNAPEQALAGATPLPAPVRPRGRRRCMLAKDALAATRGAGNGAVAPRAARRRRKVFRDQHRGWHFGSGGHRDGRRGFHRRRSRRNAWVNHHMTNHVAVTDEGAIRVIRMNRPDKKNALTHAMYATMTEALNSANGNDAIRCILICGVPGAFSAGNDLQDFLAIVNSPDGLSRPVRDFLPALVHCRKPMVAAVSGIAVGIGTTMLLHCDHVVASTTARLMTPFTTLGLVPEAASSLIGPAPDGPRPRIYISGDGAPARRPAGKRSGNRQHGCRAGRSR